MHRVSGDRKEKTDTEVVREFFLTIIVNDYEYAVLSCSPHEPENLVAGYAQSQGLIKTREDIKDIKILDPDRIRISTTRPVDTSGELAVTSSGGRSSKIMDVENVNITSRITLSPDQVYSLMDRFERYSKDFKKTGGVHSAAVCDTEKMLVFSEDIGRHNAIDRVFGQCLLEGIPVNDLFLITSGRVSSDILIKAIRREVPVLIARNSPTDLGIELAQKTGITLLGFVRDTGMNIYTGEWRIAS
jgi:FdhD protein